MPRGGRRDPLGRRPKGSVREVTVERHWGIAVDPDARQVRLRLDTPLVLRSGRRAAAGIARLAPAMARRLAALCRWQDSALALGAPVGLAKVLCEDLSPVTWLRFSSSQRRGQPIRALIGAANSGGSDRRGRHAAAGGGSPPCRRQLPLGPWQNFGVQPVKHGGGVGALRCFTRSARSSSVMWQKKRPAEPVPLADERSSSRRIWLRKARLDLDVEIAGLCRPRVRGIASGRADSRR